MNQEELIIVSVTILLLLWLMLKCYYTKIYRFYRPGCIYCIKSQDEWELFKRKCIFKMVRTIDINMDDDTTHVQKLAKRFDVKGVPTIVKTDCHGGYEVYNGDRTAEAYLEWVDS